MEQDEGYKVRGKRLRKEILRIIRERWPVHPSDVCRILDIEPSVSNISKVSYHFNVLEEEKHIRTKKIDRALVGWPSDIEKLRLIHDFMRDI